MSKVNKMFLESELGGLWSTKKEGVYNGFFNENIKKFKGKDIILIVNNQKNGNDKFPAFRLYDADKYSKAVIELDLMRQEEERISKEEQKKYDSLGIDIEIEDIY